jgi:hypothetical protein
MFGIDVTPYDKKVWEEELRDFLPDKIIDVHTHVYKREFFDPPKPGANRRGLVSWTSTVAKENPIEDKELIFHATPDELGLAVGTIAGLYIEFYKIPVGEPENKPQEDDKEPKNA